MLIDKIRIEDSRKLAAGFHAKKLEDTNTEMQSVMYRDQVNILPRLKKIFSWLIKVLKGMAQPINLLYLQ